MVKNSFVKIAIVLLFVGISGPLAAQKARIKDLVNIRGVRSNYLIGFGLVIGLNGTGDTKKSLATNKAAANLLTRLGMKTNAQDVVSGNVAAIIATADLPAFSRIGDTLDVKISTVGDAKSLAGGTLLMTPLKAGDSRIYAVAQGSVVVGQASGKGPQVLTVARSVNGATVEREFAPVIANAGTLTLSLKHPDFTTSARVADAVNLHFKGFYAKAKDFASIDVAVPPLFQKRIVDFVAEMEALKVQTDVKAKVVMNERTGTVVMGDQVTINPVTISHGDLAIQIGDKNKSTDQSVVNMGGATVGELIKTMNAIGVKPSDLVGILQAIHAAGALQAELKFL